MRSKKSWAVLNSLPPLAIEVFNTLQTTNLMHVDTYARLRDFPAGRTPVGTKDLRLVFGCRAVSRLDYDVYLLEMQAQGMVRYGRGVAVTSITVLDLSEIPEHIAKVSTGVDAADAIRGLLTNFAIAYNQLVGADYLRTGKDIGRAKRFLQEVGGLDAALRLMYQWFNLPAEHMGDDVSFDSFLFKVPWLYARDVEEQRWVDAREQGQRRRQAEAVEKTPEEFEAWKRQMEERKQQTEKHA